MRATDTTLCLMMKAPRVGQVKTRLAATVGEKAACALASAFIDDTVSGARRFAEAELLLVLEGCADDLPVAAQAVRRWPQVQGDLGARLEACVQRALCESRKVIVIGSDSPGLPLARLQAARAALERHSAVIGPADDGGFYLVGFSQYRAGSLLEIPWSKPLTRQHTVERLLKCGHSVALLEPWFDIDEYPDLVRLASLLHEGGASAPATARLLASGLLGRSR